ncbi:C2 domain-containing protein 5 isoform X3 [Stomoxys calcitrans]|uniref:C2 domain-containing protein 5 isoform X3 n=1 Tax=Stomoxys calcitrans TaxID=35570 RepID=UPI0027E2FBC3|nr:C2 domain-containing protein 5 isoform X3 [Stomoxys calcitrans]
MPGKVGVKIKAGRNLPIMDKSSDTTDAYVEIKLGNVTHKTDVCRKSLNPVWNSDWFRFELDDAELQDEILQIRLMDYDTYSANDAIGKVNIGLNPLCLETSGQISGWIPVFDTMHGIRGEVHVIVKVDLFSDVNKFRQSSCGIPFFHSPCIPNGYRAQVIHGFVEELVVNDDPEYQWIDKIRTPRASNEARQLVFQKLSGQVQRKMGLKAINMGANAVIAYTQCFDLEGDVGVVARGVGTAVSLIKDTTNQPTSADSALIEESLSEITGSNNHSNNGSPHLKAGGHVSPGVAMHADEDISAAKPTASSATINPALAKLTPSPTRSGVTSATPASIQSQSDSLSSATTISTATTIIPKEIGEMCRRSSDSDLSVTPKVIQRKRNSFCVTSDRLMAATAMMRLGQPTVGGKNATAEGLDMLEYPFLTMTKYPAGLILHIGATVAARSVKLLERVPNPDEPEIRDSWWTELRMEIRSHARSLGCNVVLGYSESTTISDDVCVLSATGTAAIINMGYNRSVSQSDIFNIAKSTGVNAMSASLEERMAGNNEGSIKDSVGISNGSVGKKYGLSSLMMVTKTSCTICHVPYNASSIPFSVKMRKCAICCKGRVPDVLLATLEVPDCVQVTGRGCFLQAQVVRAKKDLRSELNAKEISDGLPFLEYELHRVLINKLKAKGMNAIFGLRVQVSIGERMLALVATGTALFITALPVPQVPKIVAGNSWTDKQKLNELQKKLQETFERYQDVYQLRPLDHDMLDKSSDTDDSDEEGVDIDLNCGNKDTCVLEVDDIEDLEIISLLMEQQPPEGFHVVSTEKVPGMVDMEAVKNLQMFTQVWRAKADGGQSVSGFPKHFQRLLQTIYFKLRTMIPCAICDLRFKLDFPESDQIQILVTGMALGLGDPSKSKYKRKMQANGQLDSNNTDNHHHSNDGHKKATSDEDYIFPLDEDQMVETPTPATNMPLFGAQLFKNRKSSPIQLTTAPGLIRQRYNRLCERNGVDITPMSFIPGGRIEKYLGNLNFFFIRESTSVRENGGISGFVHGFITELLAVVRAHIASLGGNAMVSYYINELILYDNQHKNQGQCLISIGGDAVYVSYHNDD